MLGFHVNISDGAQKIRKYVDQMRQLEIIPCVQIFVTGPKNYKKIKISEEIRAILNTVNVFIHGAYVDAPWNNDVKNNGSIHNIRQELRFGQKIGAKGVIIHLGKGANGHTVAKIAENIPKSPLITLYLEINAARMGPHTFETPDKIAAIFADIMQYDISIPIGLCIDTAHLHSCGVSFTSANVAKLWIEELELRLKKLPRTIPLMLHLNDSAKLLGSGVDEHAMIGRGNIWQHENSGLHYILDWATRGKIPMILEIDNAMKSLRELSSLI